MECAISSEMAVSNVRFTTDVESSIIERLEGEVMTSGGKQMLFVDTIPLASASLLDIELSTFSIAAALVLGFSTRF